LNTTKRHFIAKKNASISVHKSVLSSLKFDEEALTGQCQLIKQFIDEKIAVIPSTKTLTFDAQMDLNGEQNMAIKKVSKNALTFIKGPPGCGKTKTIGRICKLMV
jgi:MoxR-like ATPase